MAKNGRVDAVKMYRERAIAAEIDRDALENDRDRWKVIAHCRMCEPGDSYYCTKHRIDEEGAQ